MGTLTPSQMFDHSLTVVKGPSLMHRLDFAAAPKSGESINQGSLASLDGIGEMVAGCAAGAHFNRPMPMWAIQGIDDFDANSDVGNMSGGVMSAIVATGGFEIETTEFVNGTYSPNDLLTGATGADRGDVTRCSMAPYNAEPVVGCVSRNVFTNADDKSVLAFWTMFLPASDQTYESSSSLSSLSSGSRTSESSTSESSTSETSDNSETSESSQSA